MAGRRNRKDNYATAQLLNYARDSYLERTSRPVYAIAFLLPFIVFYEIGTFLVNTDLLKQYQVRVVAFGWLQDLLRPIGVGSPFAWVAPPLVVIVILIGLQITSRKQWYFCLSDYAPMLCECVFLAVPLIILSLVFNGPATHPDNISQIRPDGPRIVACAAEQPGQSSPEGAGGLWRISRPGGGRPARSWPISSRA